MSGVTTRANHVEAQMTPNETRKRALGISIAEALNRAVETGFWPSEAVTYTECHLLEVKRVLDEHGLTPIASEETIETTVAGQPITGRIDLICTNKSGERVILDLKTYTGTGETERAQVSLYAHMLKNRGTPVKAAGLLIIPTTGTKLMGYITWIKPMTVRQACETLNIIPPGGVS